MEANVDVRPRTSTRPAGGRASIGYLPGLDGLRALAVLAVVAYHAPASWASGGYLGVDVFFVLSGYLITSLLLAERERTNRINLAGFWARRARRLLPALLLLVAVLAAWAKWWADPIAQRSFRGDALAVLGYFTNWHFIMNGTSYFDRFGAPSPVRHLWSLAIEEQFYLLWPILVVGVLWLVGRRAGRRAIGVLAIAGGVASVCAMAFLYQGGDASRVYFGTDTHAFGLLFGAALATAPAWLREHKVWRFVAPVALGGLLMCFVALDSTSAFAYRGGIALAALLTLPLVLAVSQDGVVARGFSWAPLVVIGMVSYGIYLWHWPVWTILTPARVGTGGIALTVVRVGALAALVTASYVVVERPIRTGALPRARWVLGPAAVAVLIGGILVTTGAPPLVQVAVASAKDGASKAPASALPRVAVVGDSTAATAEPGFIAAGDGYETVPLAPLPVGSTVVFCPLDEDLTRIRMSSGEIDHWQIPHDCHWKKAWPADITKYQPAVTVLMYSVWDAVPHEVDKRWITPGTDPWSKHMKSELDCAVSILDRTGGRILIVRAQPTAYGLPSWTDALNELYAEAARAQPDRIRLVDVPRAVVDAGTDARFDGVHYSQTGASLLVRGLNPAIASTLREPVLAPAPPMRGCGSRN